MTTQAQIQALHAEPPAPAPIHVISLGAGVQSSTMALMAAAGEITPMPQLALFADTKGEPASVYRWLEFLEKTLPFPVLRIGRKESLEDRCLKPYMNDKGEKTVMSVPAFLLAPDGEISMMPRQCTRDFKIDPITKATNQARRLAEKKNTNALLWIGISTDEIHRAKVHRNSPRIENRFPLFEKRFNRQDCLRWMKDNGFPQPPRSACFYCPYHNDAEWHRLKTQEPEEFQKAIEFEKRFQVAVVGTKLIGTPFLHRSCKPLADVDFDGSGADWLQEQLFGMGQECEGMCGV